MAGEKDGVAHLMELRKLRRQTREDLKKKKANHLKGRRYFRRTGKKKEIETKGTWKERGCFLRDRRAVGDFVSREKVPY